MSCSQEEQRVLGIDPLHVRLGVLLRHLLTVPAVPAVHPGRVLRRQGHLVLEHQAVLHLRQRRGAPSMEMWRILPRVPGHTSAILAGAPVIYILDVGVLYGEHSRVFLGDELKNTSAERLARSRPLSTIFFRSMRFGPRMTAAGQIEEQRLSSRCLPGVAVPKGSSARGRK